MFGFQKIHFQGTNPHQSSIDEMRHNYCATCKTIGVNYGQSSRMLLNSDISFLSHLFGVLTNQSSKKIEAFNCLKMPRKQDIPLHLEYTSAINIVLTKLKLEDKIIDENKLWAKALKSYYSNAIEKALNQLEKWDFPVEKLLELTKKQQAIENTEFHNHKISDIINFYSKPTSNITEVCLEEGAKLLNISKNTIQPLKELGKLYGTLIYLVDAVEDVEKDKKKNQFNAFLKHKIEIKVSKNKEELYQFVGELKKSIIDTIDDIKFETNHKEVLLNQFLVSFKAFEFKILDLTISKQKKTWKERLQFAKQRVHIAQTELSCRADDRKVSWVTQGIISSIVFLVSILEPKTTSSNYHQAGLWGCASEVWGCICLIVGIGVLANVCCGDNKQ